MLASLNGHAEVIKLLHKYGAYVELHDNAGLTALMVANASGHSEVIKLLQEYIKAADTASIRRDGDTALTENRADKWETDFCNIV